MNCPRCKSADVRVVESRPNPDTVRRRRRCAACGHVWRTLELWDNRTAPPPAPTSRACLRLGKLLNRLLEQRMTAEGREIVREIMEVVQ